MFQKRPHRRIAGDGQVFVLSQTLQRLKQFLDTDTSFLFLDSGGSFLGFGEEFLQRNHGWFLLSFLARGPFLFSLGFFEQVFQRIHFGFLFSLLARLLGFARAAFGALFGASRHQRIVERGSRLTLSFLRRSSILVLQTGDGIVPQLLAFLPDLREEGIGIKGRVDRNGFRQRG